jgi:hypothetical protein
MGLGRSDFGKSFALFEIMQQLFCRGHLVGQHCVEFIVRGTAAATATATTAAAAAYTVVVTVTATVVMVAVAIAVALQQHRRPW